LKTFTAIIVILLTLCLGTFFVLYLDLLRFASQPANQNALTAVFLVSPGERFNNIADNLYKLGVLKHPFKFRMLGRLKGYDKRIRAGEYLLSTSMTPIQILEILSSGKIRLRRVMVPEGYSLKQIATVVEQTGLVSKEEFLRACRDKNLLNKLNIEATSFEGYLFPDTYYFPRGVSAEKIISTMVKRFWSKFKPEWRKQAEELGWSVHEVVTLASIIEKETGEPSERALISSVFHNRLKRKMRLESDPTVIYGLKEFNGNLTRKHLNTPTPYNTYRIRGLPPGPISNPGAAAIRSALYPAVTEYLYFVSKRDRTHKFSTSIKEHNEAVRKYQLRR